MIDRPPQVDHLAIQLHVHLVEMPAPVTEPSHPAHALATDISRKYGTEAIPPLPHRLVTNVDAALEQQVLDVPQRQRKAHIHHDHQADHLGR
jgi:hypothetical protein